jgi:hypothetical protein
MWGALGECELDCSALSGTRATKLQTYRPQVLYISAIWWHSRPNCDSFLYLFVFVKFVVMRSTPARLW